MSRQRNAPRRSRLPRHASSTAPSASEQSPFPSAARPRASQRRGGSAARAAATRSVQPVDDYDDLADMDPNSMSFAEFARHAGGESRASSTPSSRRGFARPEEESAGYVPTSKRRTAPRGALKLLKSRMKSRQSLITFGRRANQSRQEHARQQEHGRQPRQHRHRHAVANGHGHAGRMMEPDSAPVLKVPTKERSRPTHSAPSEPRVRRSFEAPSSSSYQPSSADGLPPEHIDEPLQLAKCSSCGRSFKPESLAKHAKVCAKVFKASRKKFDSGAARAAGTELAKMRQSRGRRGRGRGRGRGRRGRGQRGGRAVAPKKGAWKAKSNALRDAMRAARQVKVALARGEDIRDIPMMPTAPVEDDRVPCPHCGRKFNQQAAERHIPKCQDIRAKPQMLRKGAGRGAGSHTTVRAPLPRRHGRGRGHGRPSGRGRGRGRARSRNRRH